MAILVAALAFIHGANPNLDPVKRFLSQYARAGQSVWFDLGVIALGTGALALAVGMSRYLRRSLPRDVGLVCLVMFGICSFLVAGFHTDGGTGGHTYGGLVHAWSAVAATLLVLIGALLFTFEFFQDQRWRPVAAASALLFAASSVLSLCVVIFAQSFVKGLIERGGLALILAWFLLVAVRLYQVAADSQRADT